MINWFKFFLVIKIIADIAKIMKLKIKPNYPRRPQKILILGPPGSGKTIQSKLLAS